VSRPVRLGAVGYLNARPLVHQLNPLAFEVLFDVPSVCFRRLANGEIDLGLIPSITYADRPGLGVVPGVGILSDGPVASVAIFTRQPMDRIRTLALDTSSRTSVALTQILCARVFDVSPNFLAHPPDLPAMLEASDAALLIGDPALFADHQQLGAEKIDLGETWANWTGLPFVWAFWAGPLDLDVITPAVVQDLQRARDAGVAASDAIAAAYCADTPARQPLAQRYLRENIQYNLDERGLQGFQRFCREAAASGIIAAEPPVNFY
jgi:predicted solute-binding protein